MDYKRRAKNSLGVRGVNNATKLQECSTFVKSSNEHQVGKLQSAMRKMDADEKLFRHVHSKRLSSVKRFHNSVNTKLTNFNDVSLGETEPDTAADFSDNVKRPSEEVPSRRGSLCSPASTSNHTANHPRRHSLQVHSSKYGRSFRQLRHAFTPATKARISPEPVPKRVGLKPVSEHPCVLLVAEARGSIERSS